MSDIGKHHIEYDINDFTDLCRATVFLLDEGHPSSVTPEAHFFALELHTYLPP
jgi:hypothetical protein